MTPPALLICLWTQKAHTDIEGHFSTTKDCKLRDMHQSCAWKAIWLKCFTTEHPCWCKTHNPIRVEGQWRCSVAKKHIVRQRCNSDVNSKLFYLVFCQRSPKYICHLTLNTVDIQSTGRVYLNIQHPQTCTIAANQPNEPKIAAVIRRH